MRTSVGVDDHSRMELNPVRLSLEEGSASTEAAPALLQWNGEAVSASDQQRFVVAVEAVFAGRVASEQSLRGLVREECSTTAETREWPPELSLSFPILTSTFDPVFC